MRLTAIIVALVASLPFEQAGATGGSATAPVTRAAGASTDDGGQLVFSERDRPSVTQTRIGDALVLVPALPLLRSAGGPAQGILSIETGARRTVIRLQPGAMVRTTHGNGRLTLDVTAASPTGPGPGPGPVVGTAPPVSGTAGNGVLPGLPASMIAVVDTPPQVHPGAVAATPAPATTPGGIALANTGAGPASPVSIAASLVPPAQDQGAGLLLPFDRAVGAAMFRRGGRLQIVFDSRKPLDLSASATDPAFRDAHVSLLPAGTLLDMPVDPAQPLTLSRVADGWLLNRTPPATRPVVPEPLPDGLAFPMSVPGQVLTVPDPGGGGDLLVGTVRSDRFDVAAAGRAPGYRIVPTLLGVAVERISDRVELRPFASGFRLIDPFPPGGGYKPGASASFSRSVELFPVDRAEQWRRYKGALANGAALAPGARRASRLEAARSAFALGLGTETRRLAQVADQDAPDGAGRSQSAFLAGAGALLTGDAESARLLADPLIGNSDEAMLWRNLAAARQDPSDHGALRAIVAHWRLLLGYPDPLRQQVLGDAALALARNGDDAARALVAALPDEDGKVGLARALVSARAGDHKAALVRLDRLFGDRDPEVSLAAGMEAIELRLGDKLITPAEAGRRMGRLIYDGRMAGREPEVAMRAVELQAQARDWPSALGILREQAQSHPDDLSRIQGVAGDVMAQAVGQASSGGGDAGTDPLPVVGLLDQNQDLLPAGADRVGLALQLADRLVARDLAGPATGFLRRVFDQASPGPDKARLGLALARALLQQDDVQAARTTLDAVDRSGLPPALAPQRTLLDARILAGSGDRQGALAALAASPDADSVALRAAMLGDAKDWQGEASALNALLSIRQPNGPAGRTLDPDTEDVVLRLAGALSRSGQPDAVGRLARTWSGAFGDRSKRDMLSLLASPDVTSVGDLPRSASDIAAARNAIKGLDRGGPG